MGLLLNEGEFVTMSCVIVAQKPWGKRRIDDIVRTGAGALNVDGGRIGVADGHGGGVKMSSSGKTLGKFGHYESDGFVPSNQGRWPSNFALCHVPPDAEGKGGCERVGVRRVRGSHSMGNCEGKDYGLKNSPIYQDDVGRVAGQDHVDPDGYERVDDWRCVEGCVCEKLGEQSGESKSTGGRIGNKNGGIAVPGGRYSKGDPGYGDKGTAARFFFQADWEYEKMEQTTTGGDMGKHEIINADVIDWAKGYDGPKFHALLCDPQYALSKKKPLDMDAPIEDEIKTVADLLEAYHSLQQWGDTGFMGKAWDDDLAFDPNTWRLLAQHLHPGAFLFAFASSRGWHRLACAMEDAGLVLQPSLFIWLNSQAFPKATRIKPNEWVETNKTNPNARPNSDNRGEGIYGGGEGSGHSPNVMIPATPLARAWEGHRYGGQVLKDAATPVLCAMKPLKDKTNLCPVICAQVPWTNPRLDCIVRTGAGSLNVDGGRIGLDNTEPQGGLYGEAHDTQIWGSAGKETTPRQAQPNGRWPSNFALCHIPPHLCPSCSGDGCEACDGRGVVGGCRRVGVKRVRGEPRKRRGQYTGGTFGGGLKRDETEYADPDGLETVDAWECSPDCPARKLGEQSGIQKSGTAVRRNKGVSGKGWKSIGYANTKEDMSYNDQGTATRFYQQCGWEYECAESCPVAKLDEQAGERGAHGGLGNFQQHTWMMKDIPQNIKPSSGGASRFYQQSDWSHEIAERLATGDPVHYCPKAAKRERNQGLDDFYWRKDKESPIGFVRITKDEWEALGEEEKHIKAETGKRVSLRAQGNIHPTLKPLALIKWLATLLSPPKEYAPRRILVPFAGTGSEMIGAILSGGFEEVVGVEIHKDYADIAEARVKFWLDKPKQMELI